MFEAGVLLSEEAVQKQDRHRSVLDLLFIGPFGPGLRRTLSGFFELLGCRFRLRLPEIDDRAIVHIGWLRSLNRQYQPFERFHQIRSNVRFSISSPYLHLFMAEALPPSAAMQYKSVALPRSTGTPNPIR